MFIGKTFTLHMVSFFGVVDKSKSFHSSDRLKQRQDILNKTAMMYGDVDIVHSWDLSRLKETHYYARNKALLDRPRGCGYWAWKPFIILETMKSMKHGDYVFYCDIGKPAEGVDFDHGNQITQSLLPIVDWAKRYQGMMPGVYLPHHGNSSIWIKDDCYKILECEDEKYKKIPTIQAGYTMWRKSTEVIEFLEEWLSKNLDSRLISDDPNVLGGENAPEFIRHCHDQAILTLLCEKNNIQVFGDPKYQFWGFRNVNFIAKQAAYENRKRKSKLDLSKLNQEYSNVVPKFLINWIEILYCERRQDVSRMLVMGDNNLQIDMWTRYFPKASVLSATYLNLSEYISESRSASKYIYDLIIMDSPLEEHYSIEVFFRIYDSLKEDGAALIGPLPKESSELDAYARTIANNNHFPDVLSQDGTELALPQHSPKIHNSKNPIFLQSGMDRFILIYKPKELINAN